MAAREIELIWNSVVDTLLVRHEHQNERLVRNMDRCLLRSHSVKLHIVLKYRQVRCRVVMVVEECSDTLKWKIRAQVTLDKWSC